MCAKELYATHTLDQWPWYGSNSEDFIELIHMLDNILLAYRVKLKKSKMPLNYYYYYFLNGKNTLKLNR